MRNFFCHPLIARPALQSVLLGLGLLLVAVASIGLWNGQEYALSQWALGAFLAPSIPSPPHSEPSRQKTRIGTFTIAMAWASVFVAIAAIWLWSQSENPYRHYVLGTFLAILSSGWVIVKVDSSVGLTVLTIALPSFFTAAEMAYYKAPLPAYELSSMSFSECEKGRLYSDIKNNTEINRKRLELASSYCKKENAIHDNSKLRDEKQKTDLATDQLKALGFNEKKNVVSHRLPIFSSF